MDTPNPSSSDPATPPAQDTPDGELTPAAAPLPPVRPLKKRRYPKKPPRFQNAPRAKPVMDAGRDHLADYDWNLRRGSVSEQQQSRIVRAEPPPAPRACLPAPTACGGLPPSVRPPAVTAGDLPPLDIQQLPRWFREVAANGADLAAAQAALMEAGLLAEPADWNTAHDLNGDGVAEWVVATAPTTRGCRNLYVTDPAPAFALHNANGFVGIELRTEIETLGDVSGDGIDDLLYSQSPCTAGAVPTTFTLYTVHTIEGDVLGASNRYGYLRLLLANAVMTQGAYREAAVIYNNLAFEGAAAIGMGWEHDTPLQRAAVERFAGARLLLADYLADREEGQTPGSDEGLYEQYLAAFPDSPYLAPVTVMVNALRAGGSGKQGIALRRCRPRR